MNNKIKISKKPWVFWISIRYMPKSMYHGWHTRGANFYNLQFYCFRISIGRPWIKTEHFGYDYVKKANMQNLKNPFSFLIGKYHDKL